MVRSIIAGFSVAVMLSLAPSLAQSTSVAVSGAAPNNSGGFQVRAVKVSYADLDVTTDQGATVLFERIGAAARAVCGDRGHSSMDGVGTRRFESCRVQAVEQAVAAVNAPQLSQVAAH